MHLYLAFGQCAPHLPFFLRYCIEIYCCGQWNWTVQRSSKVNLSCLWLLGTPVALKGDPVFLKKSLIKVLISSQLAEYFYSRNIDSVAWVNSAFFCDSEARFHWLWWWENQLYCMGRQIILQQGHVRHLCHKTWAAWASWGCLQCLGHCYGENTDRGPAKRPWRY